jgi:hypothetical protein
LDLLRLRASRVNTLAETVTQEEKEFSLQYTSPSTHFLHVEFGISTHSTCITVLKPNSWTHNFVEVFQGIILRRLLSQLRKRILPQASTIPPVRELRMYFVYRRPILCTLCGAVDFLNVLKKYIMSLYSGRGKFMPLPLKSKILETPGS